jgi:hypothetical protein
MTMTDLLQHPAVQGGLAPFLIALIVAVLLRRFKLSGLAIIAGFVTTVYMSGNFSFEPLTATRKAVLLGLFAPLLALLLTNFHLRWLRLVLAVAFGIASLWVAVRVLEQQPIATVLFWIVGLCLYVGWLVYWMDTLNDLPLRAGSAGFALGLGTGLSALFGASALLGGYGLSLCAAAGAFLLVQMITDRTITGGRVLTLPLALIAGLLGGLASLTAQLPWYALLPLALIPPAAKYIPVSEKSGIWMQSILLSIAPLVCATVAVYLVWRVAGAPPL